MRFRGIERNELAILIGVSKNELGLVLNGRKKVPEEWIFKLMKYLKYPKEHFYVVKWYRG